MARTGSLLKECRFIMISSYLAQSVLVFVHQGCKLAHNSTSPSGLEVSPCWLGLLGGCNSAVDVILLSHWDICQELASSRVLTTIEEKVISKRTVLRSTKRGMLGTCLLGAHCTYIQRERLAIGCVG